jgi:hypothetical protein
MRVMHGGGEAILVLEGVFSDEHGGIRREPTFAIRPARSTPRCRAVNVGGLAAHFLVPDT